MFSPQKGGCILFASCGTEKTYFNMKKNRFQVYLEPAKSLTSVYVVWKFLSLLLTAQLWCL